MSITVPGNLQTPAATDLDIATRVARANQLVKEAAALLPWNDPIAAVQWILVDQVQANDYNPNAVAHQEMKLLHTSISEDGYTQPVVAIHDPQVDKHIIVDGYHRYTVMRKYDDIAAATHGYLPVVVLDKPIADRMASTIRHNRARGKHSVAGMGSLIFAMLAAGDSDEEICNKLGMEPEELARLKHITGYSKLYKDATYTPLVMSKTQAEAKAAYALANPDEKVGDF
jgi:ParB-like chromosome segregation protein Spo0J